VPGEVALDPELPICDAHLHLICTADHQQRLVRQMGALGDGGALRPYLLEDLLADLGSHNIVSSVYVEANDPARQRTDGPAAMRHVGETEWALAFDPRAKIGAIVGFADLRLGDSVEEVLDAHIQAGHGLFRGVRCTAAWNSSPEVPRSYWAPPAGMLSAAEFRRGLAAVSRRGLTYDLFIYHTQLQELVSLARDMPDVTIVLNHFGGPLGVGPYAGSRNSVLSELRSSLRELAACPNVYLKLGGIGIPMLGLEWHKGPGRPRSEEATAVWGPVIRSCIETLGPDRCMFESAFPGASYAFIDYATLWNMFKDATTDLAHSERQMLFRGTAERVYRIESD
jgi:L-fuconolactonase